MVAITEEYLRQKLQQAGVLINQNNGRCALIEEVACACTSLAVIALEAQQEIRALREQVEVLEDALTVAGVADEEARINFAEPTPGVPEYQIPPSVGGWFVFKRRGSRSLYLQHDGRWHGGLDPHSQKGGYFASREEAEAALARKMQSVKE